MVQRSLDKTRIVASRLPEELYWQFMEKCGSDRCDPSTMIKNMINATVNDADYEKSLPDDSTEKDIKGSKLPAGATPNGQNVPKKKGFEDDSDDKEEDESGNPDELDDEL